MKTPEMPDPKRAPIPAQARTPNTGTTTPQTGLFRPLSPVGLGFNTQRPGRRSLLGG